MKTFSGDGCSTLALFPGVISTEHFATKRGILGPSMILRNLTIAAAVLSLGMAQEERPVWTTSKITGSPEPPPPLRAEPAFPKLTFKAPVALVPFPDGKRYVVVEEKGRLYTFPNDPACACGAGGVSSSAAKVTEMASDGMLVTPDTRQSSRSIRPGGF